MDADPNLEAWRYGTPCTFCGSPWHNRAMCEELLELINNLKIPWKNVNRERY